MFRRILIPTDFSAASEWVFDDAIRIAASQNAELIILHVRMTWADHPDRLRFPADPSVYEYVEQQELSRLRDRVRHANASLATRLIVRQAPNAGESICRTAREENVDLIVIATHARHHVSHLLVGSTTSAVLRDPPAAVLAIRYGIRKRSSIERVVVPVHAGQKSQSALELAMREARDIHLVTVCDGCDRGSSEVFLATFARPGVTTVIVEGRDPEKEIVAYAKRADCDAIFLNATASPSERKLDIIRMAPVPVMIV